MRAPSSPRPTPTSRNLFITLSARASRPDIFLVARASDDSAARKLRLAGADRVVQPYSSAGLRIANLVLKPQVADYLDIVSIAPAATSSGSRRSRSTRRATPPGVRSGRSGCDADRGDDRRDPPRRRLAFVATPRPDEVLAAGDVLIGVGSADEIDASSELLAPTGGRGWLIR